MGDLQFKNGRGIKRRIDHIVYAVSDLDAAILEFEQKFGVRPLYGGYHKTFGTKNALVNLNDQIYLELIAVDNNNLGVMPPRWMGVDLLTKNQITRWAIKSDSLKKDSKILKTYNLKMGNIVAGARNTADGSLLQWQLTMPLPTPEVELIPFLLDWSATDKHPSRIMPNTGCELIELYGTHPNPETIEDVLNALQCDFRVEKSEHMSIQLELNTPNGIIKL